ncbi:MAG TPA: DUF192 domain-containing protein [Candidatus Binatia bacterium]|jgi:uncharacterized membrane protein (UPF0127 family)|nr:DUF192 domain-containing protein [Candidatus Binatia bacterium]
MTKYVRVLNATRQRSVLGDRIEMAESRWARARGLLGRPAIAPGQGLMFTGTRAIHTCGMRYPLDVIFFDGQGQVVRAYPSLRPTRFTSWHRRAAYALELPAGTIAATATQVGDTLVWLPVEADPAGELGATAHREG